MTTWTTHELIWHYNLLYNYILEAPQGANAGLPTWKVKKS